MAKYVLELVNRQVNMDLSYLIKYNSLGILYLNGLRILQYYFIRFSYMVHIQNHPSVLIKSAVHHEVFTAGAWKHVSIGRVLSGHQLGNRVIYGGLWHHTRVVLYLLYTQTEISLNYRLNNSYVI